MQKAPANAVTQGAVMKKSQHLQFSFCRLDWCYTIQLASSLNYNYDAYWEIANVKFNQWQIQIPPPLVFKISYGNEKKFALSETKLFHFHGIIKNEMISYPCLNTYEHPFQ